MIVVRRGLGAIRDPLDLKIAIPNFGVSLSVRDVLLLLCSTGKINKTLCDLIRLKPDKACVELVNKGDVWLKDTFNSVIKGLISKVMDGFDCKASNWKDILKESFSVSITDDGIQLEFNFDAMVQSTICAAVNKAISLSFTPVVNALVKNLKTACAKLASESAPSGSTATTSTPTSTPPKTPTSSSSTTTYSTRTITVAPPSTPVLKPAVYSVQNKPGGANSSSGVLVWGGIGVALAGTAWFVFRR